MVCHGFHDTRACAFGRVVKAVDSSSTHRRWRGFDPHRAQHFFYPSFFRHQHCPADVIAGPTASAHPGSLHSSHSGPASAAQLLVTSVSRVELDTLGQQGASFLSCPHPRSRWDIDYLQLGLALMQQLPTAPLITQHTGAGVDRAALERAYSSWTLGPHGAFFVPCWPTKHQLATVKTA